MTADFKKKLWLSLGMIIVAIAAASAAFYYLAGNIASTVAGIVADRALVGKETGSVAMYSALKQQAAQAAPYQAAMEQILPTQNGLIDFEPWIAGIAAKYQVSASVKFASGTPPPASATSAGQEAFTLTASGPLNSIVAFLDDIQTKSSGFLLSLGSFQLQGQSNNYQVTAQGEVFFRQ